MRVSAAMMPSSPREITAMEWMSEELRLRVESEAWHWGDVSGLKMKKQRENVGQ